MELELAIAAVAGIPAFIALFSTIGGGGRGFLACFALACVGTLAWVLWAAFIHQPTGGYLSGIEVLILGVPSALTHAGVLAGGALALLIRWLRAPTSA